MSAMSNYLEQNLLTHIFRTGTFTKPTTIAVALLTTAAVDGDTGTFSAGTGDEVANTFAYARQTLNPADANWTSPGAGVAGETTDNASAITFPSASGGNWGTVVGVALTSSATYNAGELYFYGTLATNKVVNDGDTLKFDTGDLNVTLA